MGTSKKTKEVPKIPEQNWISQVRTEFGIPSKTLTSVVYQEAHKIYLEILMSDNDYARKEAETLVDELRMKLKNLKRDSEIGR